MSSWYDFGLTLRCPIDDLFLRKTRERTAFAVAQGRAEQTIRRLRHALNMTCDERDEARNALPALEARLQEQEALISYANKLETDVASLNQELSTSRAELEHSNKTCMVRNPRQRRCKQLDLVL